MSGQNNDVVPPALQAKINRLTKRAKTIRGSAKFTTQQKETVRLALVKFATTKVSDASVKQLETTLKTIK